ncbi:MAG TPA: PQQ-binding-like beta-propeller repeat protein [Bacteroidales bacterium]|nr:PQQ-binding-like beta-propeller repeat protein [Bacteroidales bacterium]
MMKRTLLLFLFIVVSFASLGQAASLEWNIFRGKPDLSGNASAPLPSSPTLIWSYNAGARTKSSPVVSDGTVFIGDDKGGLTAVSADGKLKWKYNSGSMLEAPPTVFGNKVIIGSNDGKLKAIDKVTGKLIWSYETENQISGSANVWVSGSKAGIVVGSYDYYLHCVDPRTGKVLWKVETDNYVNGTPAITGGKVVFGGCDGIVRIVDPLTGQQKDTINIGVYIASSLATTESMAFFGDYDGNRYGINLSEGRKEWELPGNGQGSILAIPAVGSDKIVIGSEDKYLYCYNASDGKLVWKYRTNARITGSAVISGGKVLFNGMDGFITILDLGTGKKLWSFNAGSPVSSSPAVVSGRFYILTDDGRLLAFGDK